MIIFMVIRLYAHKSKYLVACLSSLSKHNATFCTANILIKNEIARKVKPIDC